MSDIQAQNAVLLFPMRLFSSLITIILFYQLIYCYYYMRLLCDLWFYGFRYIFLNRVDCLDIAYYTCNISRHDSILHPVAKAAKSRVAV
ncbi:hypothetical protein LI328DRAFT_46137 [Trichoderma asperelloides]|nr:hypothetical protein LI328DRAFT_46137 [Trichoderma asperelloides]